MITILLSIVLILQIIVLSVLLYDNIRRIIEDKKFRKHAEELWEVLSEELDNQIEALKAEEEAKSEQEESEKSENSNQE